jgi:hypothetical protein
MSTSPLATLFKPTGSNKISLGTLGYVRARNKQRAYSLIVKEFSKSGLSQADLAKRLGKGTDVICRLLSRPGNWGLDTFSDLLFGITGSLANFSATQPLPVTKTVAVPVKTSEMIAVARVHDDARSLQSQPTAAARSPGKLSNVKTDSITITGVPGEAISDAYDTAA